MHPPDARGLPPATERHHAVRRMFASQKAARLAKAGSPHHARAGRRARYGCADRLAGPSASSSERAIRRGWAALSAWHRTPPLALAAAARKIAGGCEQRPGRMGSQPGDGGAGANAAAATRSGPFEPGGSGFPARLSAGLLDHLTAPGRNVGVRCLRVPSRADRRTPRHAHRRQAPALYHGSLRAPV